MVWWWWCSRKISSIKQKAHNTSSHTKHTVHILDEQDAGSQFSRSHMYTQQAVRKSNCGCACAPPCSAHGVVGGRGGTKCGYVLPAHDSGIITLVLCALTLFNNDGRKSLKDHDADVAKIVEMLDEDANWRWNQIRFSLWQWRGVTHGSKSTCWHGKEIERNERVYLTFRIMCARELLALMALIAVWQFFICLF